MTWAKAWKKDISEVARERVKKILKEHSPEPLYEGVGERLTQIVKEAEAELVRGS